MNNICKYYIKPRQGDNILCPADPSLKAKSQVFICASWGKLILKMQRSTTRQAKEKISANLDHRWSKKCLFLCVQTNWVVHQEQELIDFVKMTLTRVIDCESSRVILWKTRLESSRVTILLNVTRVESESSKIVTRVESLTRITLSLDANGAGTTASGHRGFTNSSNVLANWEWACWRTLTFLGM